ncbi:MAG: hypothetical protein MJH09_02095 [Cetobacterium sp.]|nr:hypothetical protein [Cetobacterium sp.]
MEYANKVSKIFGDLKTWTLVAFTALTVFKVVVAGIHYQSSDGRGKMEAVDSMKKTVAMGGGIYALLWIAEYVIRTMK